jgi:hypothetical protein
LRHARRGKVCELQELRSRNGFRLYTLSALEAEQAKTIHGFVPTDEAKGIGMYETRVEGSIPVHRLRLAGTNPAYILVSNESELQKLRYDTNDAWDFTYEGVVGYVKRDKAPDMIALHRYSKENEWRVARASRADLLNAGFRDDGLLGWAPRRPAEVEPVTVRPAVGDPGWGPRVADDHRRPVRNRVECGWGDQRFDRPACSTVSRCWTGRWSSSSRTAE